MRIEIRKAAAELRAIWGGRANEVPAIGSAPWTAFKDDPERAAAITRFLALKPDPVLRGLSASFHPDAAEAMAGAMGVAPNLARQCPRPALSALAGAVTPSRCPT